MSSSSESHGTHDLNELLERVKAATGPDRGLDGLIAIAFPPDGEARTELGEATSRYGKYWFKHDHGEGSALPRLYTASIDAALALTERMLPGKSVLIGLRQAAGTKPWARIGEWREADATSATLPLAILAALLTALSNTKGEKP
jgi:hypothetical protein